MLYTLFLYHSESGVMIYKQSFEQKLGEKSEMFASFFSAIQTFVKQMILKDSQSSGLESIDLGQYAVNITKIGELNVDCVLITDQEDRKEIKKFVPKLIKNLIAHKILFDSWDGNVRRYKVLDVEVLELLEKFKKLSGQDSVQHSKSKLMDEILGRLPELKKEQVQHYLDEKQFFEEKFKSAVNYYEKVEILNSIEDVCRKLRSQDEMEKLLKLRKKTMSEMNILKGKLGYYLVQVKTAISQAVERSGRGTLYEIDFSDAYINLYSFSSKLKLFGQDELAEKYRLMAMHLIEKPKELEDEFPQMIQSVLKLNDDISFYIPNPYEKSD